MECPFCGREMKKGVIQSERLIAWRQKRARFFMAPFFDSDSIILAESLITLASAEAYCCESCKKVIVDYNAAT